MLTKESSNVFLQSLILARADWLLKRVPDFKLLSVTGPPCMQGRLFGYSWRWAGMGERWWGRIVLIE